MDRRWIAVTVFAAGILSGCIPHFQGVAQQDMLNDGLPRIKLDTPRLSPNGHNIVFAFRYEDFDWKLAVVPADPNETGIVIINAPPGMDWISPAWVPEGGTFAAVSYCNRDNCYDGARGYNIWRFLPRPNERLDRLTTDRVGVRRDRPMFGANANELYWLVSAIPEKASRFGLEDRFLVRADGAKETVLFPDYGPNASLGPPQRGQTVPFRMANVRPQSTFNADAFYFTAMIMPDGGSDVAKAAHKVGDYRSVLLRNAGRTIELAKDFEVDSVDASVSGSGYLYTRGVYVRTHKGEPVFDFYISKNGKDEKFFRFDGQAGRPSVSGALDAVVFVGDRGFADKGSFWHRGADTIWIFRKDAPQVVDLNIPERLRDQVQKQIQLERSARR